MDIIEKHPILTRLILGLLFLILMTYGLIQARDFLYPIMLAILASFLLYPVANGLERMGLPRIVANLLTILAALGVVGVMIYFFYSQVRVFTSDMPRMQAQAATNLQRMFLFFEDKLGVAVEDQAKWWQGLLSDMFFSGEGSVIDAITGTLIRFLLIPVYVFFLLYYRDKFKFFILKLTPVRHHEKAGLILREVSYVTRKYMTGISLVVLILCVLNSAGLMIVGIRFPIMLGILSAMLNFFPYIGTWMGGAFPLTFALLTEDSPKYALGVFILFVIIQFLENNILTPNIVGAKVRINPFFVILSLIVGAMVWGLPGMFVVLPFLGMFKIVCDHVESLRPYAYLLDVRGTERHALTLDKIKRVFGKG